MPQGQVIRIRSDERVFLCGRTGSGKTYAARRLTWSAKRLLVLDPKQRIKADEWRCIPFDREAKRLFESNDPKGCRALVRAPLLMEQWKFWDDIYTYAMGIGNVLVYTDEVYLVLPTSRQGTPAMRACWTAGREIGVGSYASAQRPTFVPLEIISEADHFLVFRLTMFDDRKRMADNGMGDQVSDTIIRDKHGLFYMQAEMMEPIYFPALPEPITSKSARRTKEAA